MQRLETDELHAEHHRAGEVAPARGSSTPGRESVGGVEVDLALGPQAEIMLQVESLGGPRPHPIADRPASAGHVVLHEPRHDGPTGQYVCGRVDVAPLA